MKCWQKAANFAVNSLLCRQVEVVAQRQKDAWQTSRVREGEGGKRGRQVLFGFHYTIILLPEIMVSSRATCQKHSMSRRHMWLSVGYTQTHTLTHTPHLHTCVNSAGSCARCCKSRKSLAAQKKRKKTKKETQKATRRIMR